MLWCVAVADLDAHAGNGGGAEFPLHTNRYRYIVTAHMD